MFFRPLLELNQVEAASADATAGYTVPVWLTAAARAALVTLLGQPWQRHQPLWLHPEAEAAGELLRTGQASALKLARKRFMKEHGTVFWVLGVMQWFWYTTDRRRERFVKICEDRDVQQLTFESYMNKKLTRKKPMAHVRIFFKDMAHLLGLARV